LDQDIYDKQSHLQYSKIFIETIQPKQQQRKLPAEFQMLVMSQIFNLYQLQYNSGVLQKGEMGLVQHGTTMLR
jgi:hypothetical protein